MTLDELLALDQDKFAEMWEKLDPHERTILGQAIMGSGENPPWVPLPHQIPPPPGWYLWLGLAGRGAGKTAACAHYLNDHAEGPPCIPGGMPHRMSIIAPTLGDASDACVNGPSGLRAINPDITEVTRKGGTFVRWPNGAEAKIFGASTPGDVDRQRAGGNRCCCWAEELAAWARLRETWDHMRFGLRLGPHPHVVASTTPRNRPTIRKLVKAPTTVVTRASTLSNPHLAASVREALYDTYANTRLGLQELEGEILEDVEGAMWSSELIESQMRIEPEEIPTQFDRIVVAVDPSWGTTHDECGIIAAGSRKGTAYILVDASLRAEPSVWGETAVRLYHELKADRLIAEGNFQGEQVRLVAKTVTQDTGLSANFQLVNASRGKRLRAEPVVALCQQGRVKLTHRMAMLEFQMTSWIPPEIADPGDKGDPDLEPAASDGTDEFAPPSDFSPDRVDAFCFCITDLLLGPGGPARISRPQGMIPGVGSGSRGGRIRR